MLFVAGLVPVTVNLVMAQSVRTMQVGEGAEASRAWVQNMFLIDAGYYILIIVAMALFIRFQSLSWLLLLPAYMLVTARERIKGFSVSSDTENEFLHSYT